MTGAMTQLMCAGDVPRMKLTHHGRRQSQMIARAVAQLCIRNKIQVRQDGSHGQVYHCQNLSQSRH